MDAISLVSPAMFRSLHLKKETVLLQSLPIFGLTL